MILVSLVFSGRLVILVVMVCLVGLILVSWC